MIDERVTDCADAVGDVKDGAVVPAGDHFKLVELAPGCDLDMLMAQTGARIEPLGCDDRPHSSQAQSSGS